MDQHLSGIDRTNNITARRAEYYNSTKGRNSLTDSLSSSTRSLSGSSMLSVQFGSIPDRLFLIRLFQAAPQDFLLNQDFKHN